MKTPLPMVQSLSTETKLTYLVGQLSHFSEKHVYVKVREGYVKLTVKPKSVFRKSSYT